MAEASIAHIGAMIVIFAICVGIWFAVRAAKPKSQESAAPI